MVVSIETYFSTELWNKQPNFLQIWSISLKWQIMILYHSVAIYVFEACCKYEPLMPLGVSWGSIISRTKKEQVKDFTQSRVALLSSLMCITLLLLALWQSGFTPSKNRSLSAVALEWGLNITPNQAVGFFESFPQWICEELASSSQVWQCCCMQQLQCGAGFSTTLPACKKTNTGNPSFLLKKLPWE